MTTQRSLFVNFKTDSFYSKQKKSYKEIRYYLLSGLEKRQVGITWLFMDIVIVNDGFIS